jgi:uroporphyrinogen decarboxylase
MKPIERVLNSINHKPIDHAPRDFNAYPEIIEQLKAYFSIEGDESYGNPLLKCIDPRLLDALHCDLRIIVPEYCGPELTKEPDGSWTNLFGVKRRPVTTESGIYFSYEGLPLRNASTADVEHYPWPKPDWFDYASVEKQITRFNSNAIVAGCPGNVDFLNKTATFIGMEDLMIGLAKKNAVVLNIFDKLAEFYYEYNKRMFEQVKGKIHIAYFGDDYGAQDNLLISPKIYEELILPRFKPFYDLAKSYNLRIMHHSCGAVAKLIPYFVEAGIDILDVVQPYVPGMDFRELKDTYGDKLSFHGGICVQKVLPFATADEVRQEVEKVISILGYNGGYILSPTNKVGPEVPLANVLAMYDCS